MRIISLVIVLFSLNAYAQQTTYNYSDSLPAFPEENELEYRIKYYLAEKYTPGSCYGMPSPRKYDLKQITNYDVNATSYIKSKLDIEPNSEQNKRLIAIRIKQFHQIKLIKTKTGYAFRFTDGNCCRITTVKGTIKIDHGSIIDVIISKEEKRVPC